MKTFNVVYETLLAGTCAATAVLAQAATNAEAPHVPNFDFGNLTSTAILGWYAWHTTTRTIPQIVADFREEIHQLRDAFRQELAIERDRHRNEIAMYRGVADVKD